MVKLQRCVAVLYLLDNNVRRTVSYTRDYEVRVPYQEILSLGQQRVVLQLRYHILLLNADQKGASLYSNITELIVELICLAR